MNPAGDMTFPWSG